MGVIRATGWVLALVFLAGVAQAAPAFDVYINNKPFKGGVSGPAADVLLEAEPYFKLTGGAFEFDEATAEARLDGSPVTVTLVGGKPYIRGKEMASLMGGRYNVNTGLGTVDIYAFDPVEAARKAWERLMSQKSIQTQEDFQLMSGLTRTMLSRDLDMTLDFDVTMQMVSPEELKKIAKRGDLWWFCQYTYRRSGGIANVKVTFPSGMSPTKTMCALGSAWSETWALQLGLRDKSFRNTVDGFGRWASFYVMRTLQPATPPAAAVWWASSDSAGARQEFQRLLDMEATGGAEGVVTSIRNLAPPR